MKQSILSNIKPEAEKLDQLMRSDLEVIDNPLLAEVVAYAIFNGGKRIRPLLTVLSARLCGCEALEELYRLALTFEYLHAASLLHDDVIDHAEQRRGRITANKAWGNTHVILAGDFLHSRAMWLAGTLGGKQCLDKICQAASAMVESEFLQLQNAQRTETSEEYYFQVLKGKTAALIAAACETGVIFAGGTPDKRAALALFGSNLGLSFQIIDDLLDYQGDPARTGKAVGNDFQEGKMTLPLIYAMSQDGGGAGQALSVILKDEPAGRRHSFARARDLIEEAGGFSYARQRAGELIDEAMRGLEIFPAGPGKDLLGALAAYVLERDK